MRIRISTIDVTVAFIIFITFSAPKLSFSQSKDDTLTCETFYNKENLMKISINKKPILEVVDMGKLSYKIIYEEDHNSKKNLFIYKDFTGLNLKNYIKAGDLIKKVKDESSLLIIHVFNQSMDVQKFDLNCD